MMIPAASPWLFAISSFLIFAIVPAYTQQITGRPGSPEATTTIPSMVPALPPFLGFWAAPTGEVGLRTWGSDSGISRSLGPPATE